ncbi:hypothetical protein VTK26DRAFT_9454 [Humicola hyalothermophila]
MGRQVARPAGNLAARCLPAPTPASLGLSRPWHHHCPGARASLSPVLPRAPRLNSVGARVRRLHSTRPLLDAQIPETPAQQVQQQNHRYSAASSRSTVKIDSPDRSPLYLDSLWLRDSCPCPLCVDPNSGQKNFSTTELSNYPVVDSASILPDGSLEVVFANDLLSANKNHTSVFPAAEVKSWLANASGMRGEFQQAYPKIPWNREIFEQRLAEGKNRISYHDWMTNEDAFWRAFTDLCQTGLIFISDVPKDEKEVERIAQRIGPLQYTFYGWTWDVKSKPQAENVAYTSQFLGLHQDLMYHIPIPKLQFLHCLANDCEGGESLFSNGLRAAYEIQLTSPLSYNVLVNNSTNFMYRKNGHHYSFRHPTIVESLKGYPSTTYWAPPFQGPFRKRSADKYASLRQWKQAATEFQRIVESPRNMYEYKLREGECVVFDNRRVLHGRRQFTPRAATAAGSGGSGERWLKGAYIAPQVFFAKETELAERVGAPPATAAGAAELAEHELSLVKSTMPPGAEIKPRPGPPMTHGRRPPYLIPTDLTMPGPFSEINVDALGWDSSTPRQRRGEGAYGNPDSDRP